MLNSLYVTKSKIRKDLLILFFTNSTNKYYLRELQRILGYSAGSIRRELLKFKEDTLFNTQKTGNLLYYSLNTSHPLYNEIKSIISKTIGIEDILKNLVLKYKNIYLAFIYGSYAKKKEKSTSDIDLVLVGESLPDEFTQQTRNLELKLKREINFTLYNKKEFDKERSKDGGFLNMVLKNKIIILKGILNDK